MTIAGHVLALLALSGLLWLSALCLIATILNRDPVYALFAVIFGVLALVLARYQLSEV